MIIGIYGNIGAGKTTVSKYLQDQYGFVYFDLDQIAKNLESNNQELLNELEELKTQGIELFVNHQLNYQLMRKAIFDDQQTNEIVSRIIWKYVKQEVEHLIEENSNQNLVIEAAILPILKLKKIDYYFYIFSNQPYSGDFKKYENIIKIQNNYNQNQQRDFILENNQKITDLYQQVDQIMDQFKINSHQFQK